MTSPHSGMDLDTARTIVAVEREGGASMKRFEIGFGKAHGALLGAVGITGDTSENDGSAAVAGIESAGLTAQID